MSSVCQLNVYQLTDYGQGLYSWKVVNGGRWYDDHIMGVWPAIAIHETYRMYDHRIFVRKFTTYLQMSYGES